MKDLFKSSKIWLIIISLVLGLLSTYLQNKVTGLEETNLILDKNAKEQIAIISDSLVEVALDNKGLQDLIVFLQDKNKNLSEIKRKIRDSIRIIEKDSTIIHFIDSTVVKYIEETKPTWGTMTFSDSSNKWVNVKVVVDFPYGNKNISYFDKYKVETFKSYIGVGTYDRYFTLSGDLFYKNIGFGITADAKGNYGYAIKYKI